MDAYVLDGWQTAALIYLACGVMTAIWGTTEEAVEWYREHPDIRAYPPSVWAITLFFTALLMVVVWPVMFKSTDEEDY